MNHYEGEGKLPSQTKMLALTERPDTKLELSQNSLKWLCISEYIKCSCYYRIIIALELGARSQLQSLQCWG